MRGKTATERKKSHVGDYSQYLIEHCFYFLKKRIYFDIFSGNEIYIFFNISFFSLSDFYLYRAKSGGIIHY